MNQMFAAMLAAANAKLPYKRQLAYLEGTGTQYINTGKYAPLETDIEITFAPSELATMSVFGGRNGQQIRSCALLTISNGCRFDRGTLQPGIASGAIAAGKRYKFTYTDNVNFAIDDLETGDHYAETLTSAPAGPSGYPLALFAMNTANTKSLYFAGRIYEWKYWENGALAQHLIPVLDWSDVPCMYDKVSHQLFYNQGSGQFNYA